MRIKNNKDWRAIIFCLLGLSMLLLPFVIQLKQVWIPLWLLVSGIFCFNACIINHNHTHTPFFTHNWLNRLFGILLTLAKGHTSAGVVLAHTYNHHVHVGNSKDWIRPELAGKSYGVVRLFTYVVKAIIEMKRSKKQWTSNVLPDAVKQSIKIELLILLIFIACLLFIDALSFVLFVLMPWLMGLFCLVGVNLLQHDSCDPASGINHSRNFTGRLGNWLFFNNGFHTAHHLRPELHWSELAEYHKLHVTETINKELEQNSILLFLFKSYIFTGRLAQGEQQ